MKWAREASGFDEAFEASGRARPHYKTVLSILQGFSAPEISLSVLSYAWSIACPLASTSGSLQARSPSSRAVATVG